VIRSFKESPTINVELKNLKYRILLINKDKTSLKKTKVLDYLKQGEKQQFGGKIPASTVSCKSRGESWYNLGVHLPSQVFYPRRIGDRFLMPYSDKAIYNSDNLFPIKLLDRNYTIYLAGLLNSILNCLFNEISGRRLTGAINVVDMDVWMAKQILIPNPRNISVEVLQRIATSFQKLGSRRIEHTLAEIGANSPDEVSLDKVKPDRRELDIIVMGEILGLSDDEQLEVYRAVVDLVKSRIEKAKSFGKRGKTKEGLDIELFIKTVMDKVGEDTLGKFYQEKILSHKPLATKSLPRVSAEVKLKQDLFGWRLSSGRQHLDCSSEDEARYLKVWLEAGLESVKMPKDEDYLEEVLPPLEEVKEKIDKTFEAYLSSIVTTKLQQRLRHQLWQEVTR